MKVAVFGGSFDPIHEGHIEIIKEALSTLNIDKLFVVPTYLNPFKKHFYFSEKERLKLVKEKLKNFDKVEIIDYEIKQKRAVPTIETIEYLKNEYELHDKIYLIIGADNLKNLTKWKNYDKLQKLVEFVIATRDNIPIPKNYKTLNINKNISSTRIRMEDKIEKIVNLLDEKKAENIQVFDMTNSDYIVDSVIIATTISDKHGFALVDYLKPLLKKLGEKNIHLEQSDNWSVIDTGDMLIHLMSSDYRAKYNIEEFLLEIENKIIS